MDTNHASIITQIIQNRKSVFPKNYIDKEIPMSLIQEILENANRAPTHKLTEPWRFRVIRNQKKAELGEFLANKYKIITPDKEYSEQKFLSIKAKPKMANCIIAINLHRDEAERIPEWEELASVAMAVQNMYLTCTANKIGCYWSSPKLIKYINEFYKMSEKEKCIGLFYMGYYEKNLPQSKRKPIEDKTIWL